MYLFIYLPIYLFIYVLYCVFIQLRALLTFHMLN